MKNGMKKAILFQITSRAFVSLIPRRVSIENATKNSASHKMCIFPSTFLWDSIETSKFRELLSISNGESVGIHERLFFKVEPVLEFEFLRGVGSHVLAGQTHSLILILIQIWNGLGLNSLDEL